MTRHCSTPNGNSHDVTRGQQSPGQAMKFFSISAVAGFFGVSVRFISGHTATVEAMTFVAAVALRFTV